MKVASAMKEKSIKPIWTMRVNLNYIYTTRRGLLIGLEEDDRLYRIAKEFTFHLYLFDRNRGVTLHKQLNYIRG